MIHTLVVNYYEPEDNDGEHVPYNFNETYGEEIGQCYCEGWFC